MSTLGDALDALDALILAKIEGASDLSEFYDRRLGDLGIDAASSLEKLLGLRSKLADQAARADGSTEITTVFT